MPRWRVSALVMNLDTWMTENFVVEGVEFKQRPDASEIYKESLKRKAHMETGEVSLEIEATGPDEAIQKAKGILGSFSLALTFAYGHPVHFARHKAEGLDEGETRSSEILDETMRTGLREGSGGVVFDKSRVPDFLRSVMPKLLNTKFLTDTGVETALLWAIEPAYAPYMVGQLEFAIYWFALETMANAHAAAKDMEAFFEPSRFRGISRTLRKAARGIGLSPEEGQKLGEALRVLHDRSTMDKVSILLRDLTLPAGQEEVRRFNRWRVDIVHGRRPYSRQFVEDHRALVRLVERAILATLGVYGAEYLHQEYQKESPPQM